MSENFTAFRKPSASYCTMEKKKRMRERESEGGEGNSQISSELCRNLAKIQYVIDAVSRLRTEGRERLTILN